MAPTPLGLGVVIGVWLGPDAAGLMLPGQLVLRLLGALAPPLILPVRPRPRPHQRAIR